MSVMDDCWFYSIQLKSSVFILILFDPSLFSEKCWSVTLNSGRVHEYVILLVCPCVFMCVGVIIKTFLIVEIHVTVAQESEEGTVVIRRQQWHKVKQNKKQQAKKKYYYNCYQ